MKKWHVILGCTLLISFFLSFPPWVDYAAQVSNTTVVMHGWTFCGYGFILSPPKITEEMDKFWGYPYMACDLQIAWGILALQCLAIAAAAYGAIYWLNLSVSKNSSKNLVK
jgi:hypothetical protein